MAVRFYKRVRITKNSYLNVSRSGINPSWRTRFGTLSSKGYTARAGVRGLTYRKRWKNGGCAGSTLFIALPLLLWLLASCTDTAKLFQNITERENEHIRFESESLDGLIVYKGFLVRYDTAHKVPAYTVHRLTPAQISDSNGIRAKRIDAFWVDARLGVNSATKNDYYKSGYDRGHHVPAGDFVRSQELKDESFVFTNISPQHPDLNRKVLAQLEARVRKTVEDCTCNGYVITGAYFEPGNAARIGPGYVGVPTHLYKLLFLPDKNRMYAFWFPNSSTENEVKPGAYRVTVDHVENLTGYDFFDRLPDAWEAKLEGKKRGL